jgi:hypothetical protein
MNLKNDPSPLPEEEKPLSLVSLLVVADWAVFGLLAMLLVFRLLVP